MRCRRPMVMTPSAGRPPRRKARTATMPGGPVVALALAAGLSVAPGVVPSAMAAIYSPGNAGTKGTTNGCAYVTNAGSDTVSVINTRTNRVVADIPVAAGPTGIAATRNGRRVYVTHGGSGAPPLVSVINTRTNAETDTIPAGQQSFGVALDRSGHRAYVANDGSDTVSVIDTRTNSVSATIPDPIKPADVAVSPGRHRPDTA